MNRSPNVAWCYSELVEQLEDTNWDGERIYVTVQSAMVVLSFSLFCHIECAMQPHCDEWSLAH